MRYEVYKQLKNLSDSIIEAVSYVKEKQEAVGLLADTVTAISAIKSTFIQNEIELKELDTYLETIENIVNCINSNEKYLIHLDSLLNLAIKINKYCKDEVKYKLKVLFLAELGAKWDAMDSVYWAYKNRKDCEVQVVIAPIFRAVKYPNGEIKSDVIYRDYLSKIGINHIPFKDYDIKKELPDITFTSQPYESVTPEQFWAENVAPYTRLVYLPYYTVASISCNEQRLVQCRMPIHKLAWKVVVQSPYVKEVYKEYFIGDVDKIVPYGLPKWDYVVNMPKRNIELPDEWGKLKGKRTILISYHYNIKNPKFFMQSIKELFAKVEGSNRACIIRFHPLMDMMYNVYYTEMKLDWEKLKSKLENSKNFVIDENERYDMAFKFSDIFLTEPTSLIYQYVLTGKPIIVMYGEELKYIEEKDKWKVTFIKQGNFYNTDNIDNGYEICQKIFDGGDILFNDRLNYIKTVLPNADGKIGKRLSEYLVDEILKE